MFRWERCSEEFDPFLSVAVVDGNGDLRKMSTDFRHVSYGVHTGSKNRKKDGGMKSPESGSNAVNALAQDEYNSSGTCLMERELRALHTSLTILIIWFLHAAFAICKPMRVAG